MRGDFNFYVYILIYFGVFPLGFTHSKTVFSIDFSRKRLHTADSFNISEWFWRHAWHSYEKQDYCILWIDSFRMEYGMLKG